MAKYLLVVESPVKARKIHLMLKQNDPSSEWVVLASYGHVVDLPKDALGVNVSAAFEPLWVVKDRKRLSIILKQADVSDVVYLGTDDDREGEGIAFHLSKYILDKYPTKQVKRVRFHEITYQAIAEAINSPTDIDLITVESYITRRVLDRLIGYSISPIMWSWIGRKLSAGRVQSSALKLIVDRELERSTFVPKQQWFVTSKLEDGTVLRSQPLATEKLATSLRTAIKKSKHKVIITDKKVVSRPFPAFTTASLIRSASIVLGYTADHTMWLAQQMYEDGLITYHRTDSVGLSTSFVSSARKYINGVMGDKYLSTAPAWTANHSKAHEAIRPVTVSKFPQQVRADAQALYRLIWRQAMASQSSDAVFLELEAKAIVMVDGYGIKLTGEGKKVVFDGHYRIRGQDVKEFLITSDTLSQESEISSEFTKPPSRYTEDSLVGKLEELKIGRPSTYAAIVKGLLDNYYVRRISKSLSATQKGILVGKWLAKYFSDLTDVGFTSEMESKLDQISNEASDLTRQSILQHYWTWLEPKLSPENAWILCFAPCPQCGSELEVTMQEYGEPFLLCNSKRKGVAHNIDGLPPSNIGCGKMVSLDLGPSGEPIIFSPYDVPGICPQCNIPGKMKMISGKHGPYVRCTGCNKAIQKELSN